MREGPGVDAANVGLLSVHLDAEAKVRHLGGGAVAVSYQDVVRLEVSVHNLHTVDVHHAAGNVPGDLDRKGQVREIVLAVPKGLVI